MKTERVKFGKGVYGMMRYMERVARTITTGNGLETYHFYQLEWLGDVVTVKKASKKGGWNVYVNDVYKDGFNFLNDAMNWVANVWGNEPVMTYNMLNREAGEFPIARKQKGGCCDPATERYHCM
jgi:hypothetical protein